MLELIIFAFSIYLIYSIPILIKNHFSKNIKDNTNYNFTGRLNKKILTENEFKFYTKLKELTDKYNYIIFVKVRLADMISTTNYTDFNKIKSKHIDFIVCNQKTEFIKFIELDDTTHQRQKNMENDIKKDKILKNVGVEIFRIKTNEIDKKLEELENSFKI